VFDGAPGRGFGRREPARQPLEVGQSHPGRREAQVVADAFEHVDRASELGSHVVDRGSARVDEHGVERPRDPRPPLQRRVPTLGADPDRLLGRGQPSLEITRVLGGLRQREEHRGSVVPARRRDGGRAPEEVGGGGIVASREGAPARRAEERGRARAERFRSLGRRSEGHEVRARLLELISQDLLVLRHRVAGDPLEPLGEPLVQVGALGLRDRRVHRVSDRQMTESEGVLAGQA
jgi:hypothetical protein